jgi:hypothetical protein
MGQACIACVDFLGLRNPERFPTIGEYRSLLEHYPEPMYESLKALERSGEEAGYPDPWEIAAQASVVWTYEADRGFTLDCSFPEIYPKPESQS